MAPLRQILLVSALACAALGAPTKTANGSSACAQVSASWAAQYPATATPTVDAKLAYDCITSVPFNQSAALDLLDSIRPYFKWQSTIPWLKNPPAEYVAKIQQPVDVWGGLGAITNKAKTGRYNGEYEFGFELYTLLQSTHDGHFVFIPDSVGEIFNFGRPVALVSGSEDGTSLPVPYVFTDVLAESLGNATFKASPITKINGVDAAEYLLEWSQYGSLQDRDALYNNVFYQLAVVSLGPVSGHMGTFTGGGRGRWIYPGPTTKLEFKNGTVVDYTNFAKILTNFTGINSGADLYRLKFTTTPGAEPKSVTAAEPVNIPAPGYPPPVIAESQNLIRGYYLNEPGYEDVAVLAVPSFVSDDDSEIPFQDVGTQFLAEARAAGKTKLVIDLSANGGGTILQGYDLFVKLFPSLEPYAAADRFPAFESTDLLGQIFSKLSATVPRTLDQTNETVAALNSDVVSTPFNYRTDMTTDGKPFRSWHAKYGPDASYGGDRWTNLFRWNLSDVLTPLNSGGIYITGYGPNETGTPPQPFAAENVIVMTDGYCASTCTIFSELMRKVAGVKYVAMGGRPIEGNIQAIGGVKGSNDLPWDYIQYLVQAAYSYSSPADRAYFDTTELADYSSTIPFQRQAPSTAININFRDAIRKGDKAQTPLQFVYETADCRILYTNAMTVDATAQWKAVVDSAWGGHNSCIAGGLAGGNGTGGYVHGRATPKRHEVRRSELSVSDYPLDLYTDPAGLDFSKFDGLMMT